MKHIYCKPTIKVADLDTEDIMEVPFSIGKEVSHGSIVTGTEGDVNLGENKTVTGTKADDEKNMNAKGISFDFE